MFSQAQMIRILSLIFFFALPFSGLSGCSTWVSGSFQDPDVRLIKVDVVRAKLLEQAGCLPGALNMTRLALTFSRFVNGVAMRHGLVSQDMYPAYPIDSITNGVYSAAWTCASFRALFDRHIPGWAADPASLRNAVRIPTEEIREAHRVAKARLLDEIRRRNGVALDAGTLTIGCGRRALDFMPRRKRGTAKGRTSQW